TGADPLACANAAHGRRVQASGLSRPRPPDPPRTQPMKQTDLDPRLQLAPPGERAGLVLFLLVGVLPVALVAVSVGLQVMDGAGGTGTLLLAVAITAPAFLALWWVLRVFMHRRALRASIDALDVRSSFYHCHVDLSALDLEQARVVNLDEHPELRPLLKTNGFSLP